MWSVPNITKYNRSHWRESGSVWTIEKQAIVWHNQDWIVVMWPLNIMVALFIHILDTVKQHHHHIWMSRGTCYCHLLLTLAFIFSCLKTAKITKQNRKNTDSFKVKENSTEYILKQEYMTTTTLWESQNKAEFKRHKHGCSIEAKE